MAIMGLLLPIDFVAAMEGQVGGKDKILIIMKQNQSITQCYPHYSVPAHARLSPSTGKWPDRGRE